MALVVTPTEAVLQTVNEAIAKRVKVIVIISSGFAEVGSSIGKDLQDEMARNARKEGVRIIGPNCIGIYCPASRLPFTLGQGKVPGSVGVVSQSGFFADYLTHIATANGIVFSKAISCGNEADLCITDFLEYLGEDYETKLIVAYVEGIGGYKGGEAILHYFKRGYTKEDSYSLERRDNKGRCLGCCFPYRCPGWLSTDMEGGLETGRGYQRQ